MTQVVGPRQTANENARRSNGTEPRPTEPARPAPAAQLTGLRLKVTKPDGSTYHIITSNADLVQYDLTAYQKNWPPIDRGPILWASFVAWHASRRLGIYGEEMPWEKFWPSHPQIDNDPAEPAVVVDPTQPDPESGFA